MKTTNFANGFTRLLIANLANLANVANSANSANLEGENSAWLMANPANVANLANASVPLNRRAGDVEQRCAKVLPGAEYTIDNAGNLPDSEVFSRPRTLGLGRDGLVRKAGRMALSMYSTSRHPLHRLNNGARGFKSHNGAETMTTVTSPTTSKATRTPTGNTSPLDRQQAIENALSMALFHVRQGSGIEAIQAATGRAIRAAAMLKQACTELKTGGAK